MQGKPDFDTRPAQRATTFERRRQCAAGVEDQQVAGAKMFPDAIEARMRNGAALTIKGEKADVVAPEAAKFGRFLRA